MNDLVGKKLYGYCNGYFGRDSYGEKTIIAAGSWDGELWVVVKEHWGLNFANGFDKEDLARWLDEDDD